MKKLDLIDPLVKPAEFAEEARIHRTTLARMVKAGTAPPPCLKRGRLQRWRRSVVDRFLNGAQP